MVYDQSLTALALALLPTRAAPWSEHVTAGGTELLPAAAMGELMTRALGASLITKDQLLNLAAELLPVPRMREVLRFLEHLSGYDEWNQVRLRRRRAITSISLTYLTRARLQSGGIVGAALLRHQFDLESQERETFIIAYANLFLDDGMRRHSTKPRSIRSELPFSLRTVC